MTAFLIREMGAALVSAAVAITVAGCAGSPRPRTGGPTAPGGVSRRPDNPDGTAAMRGDTNGAGGAATVGQAGVTGNAALLAPQAGSRDQGQQVSDLVARIDGLSGGATTAGTTPSSGGIMARGFNGAAPGGADGRPIGVSTLVIGNLAYVGIDRTTIGGAGTRGGAASAGSAAGGPAPDWRPTGDAAGGAGWSDGVNMEERIRLQVRAAFPTLADVFVTTEPTLVHRLAQLGGKIQAGASTADQLDEMFKIAHSMQQMSQRAPSAGAGTAVQQPGAGR